MSAGPPIVDPEEQTLIDEANGANAANAALTPGEMIVKSFLRGVNYLDTYILVARDYFDTLIANGLTLTLAEESDSRVLVSIKALRPEIASQLVADGQEVPEIPEVGEVVAYDSDGVEVLMPEDEAIGLFNNGAM